MAENSKFENKQKCQKSLKREKVQARKLSLLQDPIGNQGAALRAPAAPTDTPLQQRTRLTRNDCNTISLAERDVWALNKSTEGVMSLNLHAANLPKPGPCIDHRDMDKQLTQYNWSYVCLTKDV